jgi:hypothetical protein
MRRRRHQAELGAQAQARQRETRVTRFDQFFLEPNGSKYLRYTCYSGMAQLLAHKSKAAPLTHEPNIPLVPWSCHPVSPRGATGARFGRNMYS